MRKKWQSGRSVMCGLVAVWCLVSAVLCAQPAVVGEGEWLKVTEMGERAKFRLEDEDVSVNDFRVSSLKLDEDEHELGVYFATAYEDGHVRVPNIRFRFEPAVPNVSVAWDGRYRKLTVHGEFRPETTYRLRVEQSETPGEWSHLAAPYSGKVTTWRQRTMLERLSQGVYLPLGRGNWTLPLTLRNVAELKVKVHKVFANNLLAYGFYGGLSTDNIEYLLDKTCKVQLTDNVEQPCCLSLQGVVPADKPGLYRLDLAGTDRQEFVEKDEHRYYWNRRTYGELERVLVVVTDLGVTACVDAANNVMLVSVHSLSANQPVEGTEVVVYSVHNQVLAKGVTDGTGMVRIVDYGKEFKNRKPASVAVKKGEDISMLVLKDHGYDNGLEVRPQFYRGSEELPAVDFGPQAFVYTERGAVRPGESVTGAAWLRQRDGQKYSLLADCPCVMELRDSQHDVVENVKVKTDRYGFVAHEFKLDGKAPTGEYEIRVSIEEGAKLGSTHFLVNTYVPDQIEVTLSVPEKVMQFGAAAKGTVSARYYFGKPATNLKMKWDISFEKAKAPVHWQGYAVGDEKSSILPPRQHGVQNPLGTKAVFGYDWPAELDKCYIPLLMVMEATVIQEDGRGVTAWRDIRCDSTPWYLGVKKGDNAERKAVLWCRRLTTDAQKTASDEAVEVKVELFKREWEYLLKRNNRGHYEREWEQVSTPYGEKITRLCQGTEHELVLGNLPSGNYEAVVSAGERIQTRLTFWHWQGEAGKRLTDPKALTFTTDRERYGVGEQARLSFEVPEDGFAAVAYGEGNLQDGFAVPVKAGKNEITVTIPAWLPTESFYCGVTAVTGSKDIMRQFGVARLAVDQSSRKLDIGLKLPEIVRPRQTMEMTVQLKDAAGKPVKGLAHVFCVDRGILSLTNFKTPDIFAFYHGPRDCGMGFYDIYDLIFPDLELEGVKHIGGDMAMRKARIMDILLKKSAVVVLPPVETGEDGTAALSVPVPDFLGGMRVMCVASDAALCGSAQADVVVREEIDVQASGPRVTAPGDEGEATFVLHNFDMADGPWQFTVTLPEALTARGGTEYNGELKKGESETVRLRYAVGEQLGRCIIRYQLKMGDKQRSGELPLTVRSVNPPVTVSESQVIAPGATVTFNLTSAEWLAGTARGTVTVLPNAVTGLSEALGWLNAYPYGCLEQTTACAFPFLALDKLVKGGFLGNEEAASQEFKVQEAVKRIKTMYLGNGRFSLWPGSREPHQAAGIFAAHYLYLFNQRHPLDQEFLDDIGRRLQSYAGDAEEAAGRRGYVCYILSLRDGEKENVVKIARDLASGNKSNLSTFLAAAALVNCGYAAEAMPTIKECLKKQVWKSSDELYAMSDEVSRVAMVLSMVMDILPGDPSTALMAEELSRQLRPDGRGWGTTQNNAWATLGLASYAAFFQGRTMLADVKLNEAAVESITVEKPRSWKLNSGDALSLTNSGNAPMCVRFRKDGIPRAVLTTSQGVLGIRRRYLNKDGQQISQAESGELLTVELVLEARCPVDDLAVVDMLPGCLEIEDSTLSSRARAVAGDGEEKSKECFRKQYVDGRDDRMLLFGNMVKAGVYTYKYHVRAVAKGRFCQTPAMMEAMYLPDLRATFGGEGTFTVK